MKRLFIVILFGFCIIVNAASITAKCITVIDGDTVIVEESDGSRFRIRLAFIDAPEMKQPGGVKAKEYLTSLLKGKDVIVKFSSIDKYGRIIGVVYREGDLSVFKTTTVNMSVNYNVVYAGHAWYYKDYAKDINFERAEERAKEAKVGLWQNTNPQAPWAYREEQRRWYNEVKNWVCE